MPARFDEDSLLGLAQQVLAEAKLNGADAAEVVVGAGQGVSVTARNSDVETLEHNNDHSLTAVIYIGRRKGVATVSDFTRQSIVQTIEAAVSIARHTSQDECSGLADADLMATDIPDLGLDNSWQLEIPQVIDKAVACEAAMYDNELVTNTDGAIVSTGRGIACYANSHGFAHAYARTSHNITAIAVAGNNSDMQRDYWYTAARHPDSLEAPEVVGHKAALRAVNRLGARSLTTRKVPVMFEPQLACGLMGTFIGAVSGGALYRKASFLHDAIGQSVFPHTMQIYEQPRLFGAMGSAPFDGEGVATRDNVIVRDGVLQSYVLDSYSARRLNMQTTGNAGGVFNLTVDGSGGTYEEVLQKMGTGFLVGELIGHGINLVTGDYSRGAVGFWVEDGEIQYPVQEVTIAGSLPKMFENIVMVGDDADTRGNIRCGSVLIGEMTVAG